MLQMARQIQLAIIVLMGRVDIPMVAVVLWREDGVAGTPSRQQAPTAATERQLLLRRRLRVPIVILLQLPKILAPNINLTLQFVLRAIVRHNAQQREEHGVVVGQPHLPLTVGSKLQDNVLPFRI